MKKIIKVIKKGFNIFWCEFEYAFKKLFSLLPAIFIVLNPFFSMIMVISVYEDRGCFRVGGEWLFPVMLLILAALAKCINEANKDTLLGFPVAKKRFTKCIDDRVIFSMGELYEMLDYLAQLEDYCEKHGKYSGDGEK